MGRRQAVIAQSVTHSIVKHDANNATVLAKSAAFFYLYWIIFECVRAELFKSLREGVWKIDENEYLQAFGSKDKQKRKLKAMGDMGYSGSTFFATADERYIVKSIPRKFEHDFFKNDLLVPYSDYVRNNSSSLLIRITEFLENTHPSIGTILGLAPSHHIVMENVLYGKKDDWESFDLKPMSYFYPERDVAGGALSSEATKSKLADDFNDKLVLTLDTADDFKAQLEKDTRLLSACNAVDYSLFLVRIPKSAAPNPFADPDLNATPLVPPGPPSWRTGVESADGKWVFRAAILDFFWAKHTVHAKAMTGLIKTYNIFDRKGHMSVTTDSSEYRTRFLKMCTDLVEVQANAPEGQA